MPRSRCNQFPYLDIVFPKQIRTRSMRKLLLFLASLAVLFTSACNTVAQDLPAAEARYVASTRGSVYYPVECEAWQELSERNRIFFGDAREAEKAGYTRTTNRSCAPSALATSAGTDPQLSDGSICTIERVVDGDTVVCEEGSTRIRLLLIDAPEMSQGRYGRLARDAMLQLLPPGARVRLELDVQPRDRYGRTLAYLHTSDGWMVNEEMVRQGYALVSVYPPNVRHVDRLRSAAEAAREARLGLWSGSAFECSPAEHRAGSC